MDYVVVIEFGIHLAFLTIIHPAILVVVKEFEHKTASITYLYVILRRTAILTKRIHKGCK